MSTLHPELTRQLSAWADAGLPEAVGDARRADLQRLADWIAERHGADQPAPLLFVCTHNSRRSHMGQVWAAAAAAHHGLDTVTTWSGGTEATAFEPRAVAALVQQGFDITDSGTTQGEGNEVYTVSLGPDVPPLQAFSKVYDDPINPSEGLAAIMVCTEADAACPIVPGADLRISLPFADPKLSDGTAREAQVYRARSARIGQEIAWVMARAAA